MEGIFDTPRDCIWVEKEDTKPVEFPELAVLPRKLLMEAVWLVVGVAAVMTWNLTSVLLRRVPVIETTCTSLDAVRTPRVWFIQTRIVSLNDARTGPAPKKSGCIPAKVKVA